MTKTVETILSQVASLPEDERLEICLELMGAYYPVKSDDELLTVELKAELDRRIADMEAHPERAIPSEVVHERLRRRIQSLRK